MVLLVSVVAIIWVYVSLLAVYLKALTVMSAVNDPAWILASPFLAELSLTFGVQLPATNCLLSSSAPSRKKPFPSGSPISVVAAQAPVVVCEQTCP
jgi:hypothetical protein